MFSKNRTMLIKGEIYSLATPKVMGILNVTPDSFYDGGKYTTGEMMMDKIYSVINEGADIIDIGAFSSRPGAKVISIAEEKERLKPALSFIRKLNTAIPISLDTMRSEIVQWAIENYDIDIINDISGGQYDKNIFKVAAKYQRPYIIMHMRGTPENMQDHTNYNDLHKEIISEIAIQVDKAYNSGINDVIIDPGFGFSKTREQNYEMLKYLELLDEFELPVLVGLSRKSMIYKLLNISAEEALNGTTALHMACLMKGVNILRVHDIPEAKQVIKLFDSITNAGN